MFEVLILYVDSLFYLISYSILLLIDHHQSKLHMSREKCRGQRWSPSWRLKVW